MHYGKDAYDSLGKFKSAVPFRCLLSQAKRKLSCQSDHPPLQIQAGLGGTISGRSISSSSWFNLPSRLKRAYTLGHRRVHPPVSTRHARMCSSIDEEWRLIVQISQKIHVTFDALPDIHCVSKKFPPFNCL